MLCKDIAYYQIGGFNGHTKGWFGYNDQRLCEEIFDAFSLKSFDGLPTSVELVLGILNNGASYLLVPSVQMDTACRDGYFYRQSLYGKPKFASQFLSLSPILFKAPADLAKKLKAYSQKPKKKGRREPECTDSSQANKMYCLSDLDSPSRARFEHQRLLWCAIQGIDDFARFSMPEVFWLSSTTVVSLSMNFWETGQFQNLRKNPTILDVGWTSISCMTLREKFEVACTGTTHIVSSEHVSKRNKAKEPAEFLFGETLLLERNVLANEFTEFVKNVHSERVFLLVHDKERTLNALVNLNIATERWQSDIGTLLRRRSYYRDEERPPHRSYENFRKRSRSRSPRSSRLCIPSRPRTPPAPRRAPSPVTKEEEGEEEEEIPGPKAVYVIDIQELFQTLSGSAQTVNVATIATRLGFKFDESKYCAGNECHLLIRAWQEMASGNAVDEQRVERWPFLTGKLPEKYAQAGVSENCLDSAVPDEEVDVNDALLAMTNRSSVRPGPYEDDEDGEEYYDF